MIAIRPGTKAWDVLVVVVDRPGRLDAEAIGDAAWRPRITSTAAYPAVRRAILQHGAEWTGDASEALHRLQERGLVERERPYQIAPRYALDFAEDPRGTVDGAAPADSRGDVSGERTRLLLDLVRRAPTSMREWVGDAPSGWTSGMVADLVAWGLVVPPAYRWPTEAGIALVMGAREAA